MNDLLKSLLDVRRECKSDGIEFCRMESVLAKFMDKHNFGFVCPNCDYPMVEKPSDNLCKRCFGSLISEIK